MSQYYDSVLQSTVLQIIIVPRTTKHYSVPQSNQILQGILLRTTKYYSVEIRLRVACLI